MEDPLPCQPMEELDYGRRNRGGEKWLCETQSEQVYIFKVEPVRVDNGLDLECGENTCQQ